MLFWAIVAAVFWLVVRELVAGIIAWVIIGGGMLLAHQVEKFWVGVLAWIVGILAVIVWEIIAITWIVYDVINIIKIATGH